jgi:small subunit ribosomal protein S4
MSRITVDAKCRLCRREGNKLYLKGARCYSAKCPLEKKGAVVPGMHGLKNPSKPTDYGIQLRAKQKAKRIYGVQETQFRNYYYKAKRLKGLVGDNLLILLEKRLDNALYLAGLSLSRSSAKQIISHRHVLVNGKYINVPSYEIKVGDEISLDQTIIDQIKDKLPAADGDFKTPSWLDVHKNKFSAKVISLPQLEELTQGIDINLIVEYYSR